MTGLTTYWGKKKWSRNEEVKSKKCPALKINRKTYLYLPSLVVKKISSLFKLYLGSKISNAFPISSSFL